MRQLKATCEICGSSIAKNMATRHLDNCIEKSERQQMAVLQMRASAPGLPYWMLFDVNESSTLADVDDFLRAVWLECCGHLSAFQIGDTTYTKLPDDFGFRRERPMTVRLRSLLPSGTKFSYEYDFGSTTELLLEVVERRMVSSRKAAVRLLAMNEAPTWSCEECGAPAVVLCSECQYEADSFLCADHARTHSCGEEMLLPVVNSPRMGICGYTGTDDCGNRFVLAGMEVGLRAE